MKKTKLLIILSIILAIFAVVKVFIIDQDDNEDHEETIALTADKSDIAIKNVHYVKTNLGVKEWELRASSGQYFKNKDLAIFKDIVLKVFPKDGKPFVLVGDEGKATTTTRDVEIQGNVVASSDNQYKFYTQSLKYDSKKRRIHTADKIKVAGHGMEIRGVGMTVDIDRERFFVLNSVSTILKNVKID